MKNTLLILFTSILIFSGCSTLNHIDGYEKLTGIDFRPYAEKDFLITPYAYSGEYISVYMINYIIMPEGRYTPSMTNASGTMTVKGGWTFSQIETKTALNNIYDECVEMGADALMDFRIQPYTENYSGIDNPVTVDGIQITGIAIKRTE